MLLKGPQDFPSQRAAMVEKHLWRRDITDERVLEVMGEIPREIFVPENETKFAYNDNPLPIGEKQTISQPYIVALMTQYLDLQPEDKVLEIGTGSGYQTAILAKLAGEIYTVERLENLSRNAQNNLSEFNFSNIYFKVGDGTEGWEEKSPFNKIMVTAAAPGIPVTLKNQLEINGVLVIPVGNRYSQDLYHVKRTKSGFEEKRKSGCVFVPLIGKHGWE